jgi:hypothetical protein
LNNFGAPRKSFHNFSAFLFIQKFLSSLLYSLNTNLSTSKPRKENGMEKTCSLSLSTTTLFIVWLSLV